MSKICIAPTNANKVYKAIEVLSEACGLLQTAGLPYMEIRGPVVEILAAIEKVQQLTELFEVVASGRGRGRSEGNGNEALTQEEVQGMLGTGVTSPREEAAAEAGIDVQQYFPGGQNG